MFPSIEWHRSWREAEVVPIFSPARTGPAWSARPPRRNRERRTRARKTFRSDGRGDREEPAAAMSLASSR